MSDIPEVFAIFEQKLAHVLSFNLRQKGQKKAIEELLIYFSGIVERASKAESRIAELEAAKCETCVHYVTDSYKFYSYPCSECKHRSRDSYMPLPTPPEVQE